jgi:adhesin transport system outer membrane protein
MGAAGGNPAAALSLREAVSVTLDSNPQIGAAIENREAIEFELRQARGLFLPRVDAEGSAGARRLDREVDRLARLDGTFNRDFTPVEAGVTVTWKLFDGFSREAEVERQASRVDGASFRVLERSEFLALEVSREYFEVLLDERLVRLAEQNIGFLDGIVGRIRTNASNGSLTEADLQQGEERVLAGRARLIEARQDLAAAKIRFLQLVGKNLDKGSSPPPMGARLPKSIDDALGLAVLGNPRLKLANADIDAAHALVKQARSRLSPEFFLEGSARRGVDIDGVADRTTDVLGRGVMRWNLFNGGIDQANIQEQTRRVAEAQFVRDQVLREIREAVRLSFDRRLRQAELAGALTRQVDAASRVVRAYDEQFQVGRRSLLDLLDAQNTRFNGQALLETARTAAAFAEYRILASTGQLVTAFGLKAPSQAEAYARVAADVPPTAGAETLPRYSPPKGKPWAPEGAIH